MCIELNIHNGDNVTVILFASFTIIMQLTIYRFNSQIDFSLLKNKQVLSLHNRIEETQKCYKKIELSLCKLVIPRFEVYTIQCF